MELIEGEEGSDAEEEEYSDVASSDDNEAPELVDADGTSHEEAVASDGAAEDDAPDATPDDDDSATRPALERLSVHETRDVTATVASDLARRRASQGRRHHGRGKVTGGKGRGPKAKQDASNSVKDALSGW
jgi:hypothetical protein